MARPTFVGHRGQLGYYRHILHLKSKSMPLTGTVSGMLMHHLILIRIILVDCSDLIVIIVIVS
jgi:hypothetical protein